MIFLNGIYGGIQNVGARAALKLATLVVPDTPHAPVLLPVPSRSRACGSPPRPLPVSLNLAALTLHKCSATAHREHWLRA
ncbi:hypothetical protein E2N91_21970 [Pseudomonas syringae pv. tomato]|nr:hypothetical protein DND90_28160 [Pseudomonas syringae pv. maculicola]TES55321.1 hypothetical protein E2N91_21970 [Pseudomonas syringae pv. tomato]TES77150.1 hypothetical protein E2N89_15960 [Pseudomonas syringae pv. tomato]